MSFEIIAVLFILSAAILLFISGIIRMDLTALLVLVTLALTNLVSPSQALSGFSNQAVITVWAMFILSAGLAKSGISSIIGERLLRAARSSESRLIAILMTVTALLSSIMNNIAVAAMFLPVTLEIARQTKRPPSRLLMPMAHGSLLGGLILLIGTASNLVVRDAMLNSGIPPLGMFDFVPSGLIILLLSTMYMTVIGRRFLPYRQTPQALSAADSSQDSNQDQYALEERLATLIVPEDSPLAGKSVAESRIGRALGLNILSIQHKNGKKSPPEPNTVLEGGDHLLVLGRLDRIEEIQQRPVFQIEQTTPTVESLLTGNAMLAELDIAPDSPLASKTLHDVHFRRKYHVNVLAIRQKNIIRRTNLQDLVIQPGDKILIHGLAENFEAISAMPGFRRLNLPEVAEYHLEERLLTIRIPENSILVGRTLAETRLGSAYGLAVLKVSHDGMDWSMPKPETILQGGDLLVVGGRPLDIDVMKGLQSLKIERKTALDIKTLIGGSTRIVEVMLSPHTSLTGKTLRDLRFRERYGISVLAIWRGDRAFRSGLGDFPLQYGDALLCYGEQEKFKLLARERDYVVLQLEAQEKPRTHKAPLAALIMALVIFSAILLHVPIAIAAIGGCILMVLGRVLSMDEAYQSIDWRSIFLISSMIPLGIAMQQTGTAAMLSNLVVSAVGGYGPSATLAGLMALCMAATMVMPAPVVAVIMSPLALDTAIQLGISPHAFLLGIANAIAASFLSPVSIPVNILIMSPGGYRYGDYIRHGLPICLIVIAVSVAILPVIFPY